MTTAIATQLTEQPRYHMPMPYGWYCLGYSAELPPGEVKPLHYFGENLVLFRTESGVPAVLDAYCPHLGAHLGHGGKVQQESVACPFHGWRFNPAGECVEVPYAKKNAPQGRLRPVHPQLSGH